MALSEYLQARFSSANANVAQAAVSGQLAPHFGREDLRSRFLEADMAALPLEVVIAPIFGHSRYERETPHSSPTPRVAYDRGKRRGVPQPQRDELSFATAKPSACVPVNSPRGVNFQCPIGGLLTPAIRRCAGHRAEV